MKKITVYIVIVTMVLTLSACGGSSDKPEKGSKASTGTEAEPKTDEENGDESQAPANSGELSYTLANAVITDGDDFTFTITDINAKGTWGLTFNVLLENNTDKTLMFSWDDVSVNGYMIDPFWSKEVAPGKKANSGISFSEKKLEECNITSADEVIFTLKVYDSNDWSADRLLNDVFTIYPTGLDAGSIARPERSVVAGEETIVDDENCTFIIQNTELDSIWGYTLNCYLENKTADPLMFTWNDVSVNGYMVDPFWSKEVAPGKNAFSSISFSESGFEKNGIEEVEEIEFELRIYNSDDWSAPDISNGTYTYTPQ